MRFPSFTRPVRIATATMTVAGALIVTLAVTPAASAQTPTGPQPTIGPGTPPDQICIQVYPPPPGCPTNQPPPPTPPPTSPPAVCIQIYPPPPGCPGGQPPSQGLPPPYPGHTPSVQPAPVQLSTAPPLSRPGRSIVATFRVGGVPIDLGGLQCQEAWFEALGPGGWTPAPGLGGACSLVTFAPGVAATPVVQVAAGHPSGTYRLVLRVTSATGGSQIICSDPFVVG